MNNANLKASEPVFEPLPEITESNTGQLKTSYPRQNQYRTRSYNSIPPLSELAIKAAAKIQLPDIKTKMRRTEEWIQAFKWYNEFVHKGSHPLGMGCHPCWDKAYNALRKAKE